MKSHFDAPYVVEAKGEQHKRTIIFVHGRDSNGEEFANDFFEGECSNGDMFPTCFHPSETKWIFPSAHMRTSTRFDTEIGEWFDIYSLSEPNEQQELQKEGLKESIEFIHSLITAEIEAGIKPENIILGGISQGFATAIHTLLSQRNRLGGFIGLSGWFPFSNLFESITTVDQIVSFYDEQLGVKATTTASTLETPVFVSHAADDSVIEPTLGSLAVENVKKLGLAVEWKLYEEGEHWINEPQGYDDLARFMACCCIR